MDPSKLSIAFTDRSLCTRSATCVGLCPSRALALDDEGYPIMPDPAKCTECGLCAKVCPGGTLDYGDLTEWTFGHRDDPDTFDGIVSETWIAHATDERMRAGGAGGGVVTALLWDQLKHGEVDGCIVTRMNPDRPWRGEPFIARSREDLLASQGSKYSIVPVNAILREALDEGGRYAFAALPCQVHGFRKAVAERPELAERIRSVVGLFCGGGLEPHLVPELLRTKGVRVGDIRDFQFRGGDWPGKMRAVLRDGAIRDMHYSNYKDGAYNYIVGIYMPPRCTTCLDGSCEFSDLSVSDAWTRDENGDYKFPRHSRILARTPRGVALLRRAIERGTLKGHDLAGDPNFAAQTHHLQTRRKGLNAPLRVARQARAGRPVPRYDRPVPESGPEGPPDRTGRLGLPLDRAAPLAPLQHPQAPHIQGRHPAHPPAPMAQAPEIPKAQTPRIVAITLRVMKEPEGLPQRSDGQRPSMRSE